MAHTRTEYTIAAGFSGSDALAKLGEALFGLGIMTSATAWFDSFTDVSGSEVRIVEMAYTGNSGTYNKVYHAFATKSTFDGLWYTVYYNWDVATHESLGTNNFDHVSSFEHPDDVTPSSWGSYYTQLALLSNAADYKITTYADGSNIPVIRFSNSAESRVFCLIPTASALSATAGYSDYGPAPLFGLFLSSGNSYYTLGHVLSTDRSVTGRGNTGTSSNDWAMANNLIGTVAGNGQSSDSLAVYATINSITGSPALFYNSTAERVPYYTIAKNPPAAAGYYDATFGSNLAVISANNNALFVPVAGDTLTVTAAVEEYEVLYVSTNSDVRTEWQALLSRTV